MFRTTRSIKLAVLAALVAAATVTAGSARAATAVIDTDSVPTIGTNSFSFTGTVDWLLTDGMFTPGLWGTLPIDNASGSCARMRMEYFHDNASIAVRYGGTVCAPDGKEHDYSVNLTPYSSADTDLLKVSVEKQTAANGSDYSIVESAYVAPNAHEDGVMITSKGLDFGGPQWSYATAQPTGLATVYWNRGDGGVYTPRLIGDMWLNNSAGVCARINLRFYTVGGGYLTEKHGGSGCATGNNLNAISVDLQPYTSSEVGEVEVQLQTQGSNGSWNLVGSDRVSIDEHS
jgi:hypothetical protein